jgi:hypothetical protein
MKATIDFDEALYRRLKIEAARRNRTIRDLIAEGVRHVLDAPAATARAADDAVEWQPSWFGALGKYGNVAGAHDMPAIRNSIARARGGQR